MFPREKRLSRAAFPLASRSKRASTPHFSATTSQEVEGYAVVASKKTFRLSTTRHRIKRRIIEILRTLPLPPSLVIFPKTGANQLSHKDLHEELATLLSKIGV